ncbi:MAG: RsmE family RNA methyltransferase [Rhodothermales bacterium]
MTLRGTTTQFYVPREYIHGDRVALPEEEARHAVRALRLSVGDELVAVDGEGGWYRIVLDHAGREGAGGHIVERLSDVGEPSCRLTMAMGMIKHRGRFETFLEKAVELGVSEIVPLITDRTEKEGLKERRAEKILVAGLKQCGRSRLPVLQEPMKLAAFLRRSVDRGFCCHEAAGSDETFVRALRDVDPGSSVSVLVGPEGGFTDDEIAAARQTSYAIVSLGARRLRTETAAIAAAAVVSLICESA